MSAKESITSFLRRTNFRVLRKRGATFLEKINVKESIRNAKDTFRNAEDSFWTAEESITSFFRKIGRERDTTYVGKLDGNLVASRKPVIIFEHPHILHAADTVEDATTFLAKLDGVKAANAALYLFDTDRWQRLNVPHK